MPHQIWFSVILLQWSTSHISLYYPIITLFVCQFAPMNTSFWKTLLWEAPLIGTERSKQDTELRNYVEHFLILFARLICIRTYGRIQNITCFISVGYVLVSCFWLLKAVFKFDHHLNPLELVIRQTCVTVEKSSSHRKSIFHMRIINKSELETFFSKCWKQQNVYICFFFFQWDTLKACRGLHKFIFRCDWTV